MTPGRRVPNTEIKSDPDKEENKSGRRVPNTEINSDPDQEVIKSTQKNQGIYSLT